MKCVSIGRIVSTHGLKGEVKFLYYNETSEGLYNYKTFLIKKADEWVEIKPERIRQQKGFFFIKFHGHDTIEKVTSFTNKELFVKEEDLPPLNEDEYYDYQLIGLNVIDEKGTIIGIVDHIIHTKANDILVVKREKEILIPMIDIYIKSIDLKESVIQVEGEGFLA
ncbi:MAG: ribosome maturation factor RimM [Syntrophorhabdaceae bacterium]|nr:ribosome maturation factor RimM [Syntrophorhabdaceae bacterium]